MAGYISDDTRKVTTHRLVEMKQRGEKISMLTAVSYTHLKCNGASSTNIFNMFLVETGVLVIILSLIHILPPSPNAMLSSKEKPK